MERSFLDKVNYWLNLTGLKEKDKIRQLFIQHKDKIQIIEKHNGVIAFMIAPDFKGGLSLIEVFFFLHPKHRDLSNCNKLLELLENTARLHMCKTIKFGANFGHKDEMFLKYLRKKGYKDDTLSKEI